MDHALRSLLGGSANILRYHSDARDAIFHEIQQLDLGLPRESMRLPTIDEWIKREVLRLQLYDVDEVGEFKNEVARLLKYNLDVIDNAEEFRMSRRLDAGEFTDKYLCL
jgi:hypothetical protein